MRPDRGRVREPSEARQTAAGSPRGERSESTRTRTSPEADEGVHAPFQPRTKNPEAPRHTPHALSRTSRRRTRASTLLSNQEPRTKKLRATLRTPFRVGVGGRGRGRAGGGLTSAATANHCKPPSTTVNHRQLALRAPRSPPCPTIPLIHRRTPRSSPRRCGASSTV